MTTGEKTESVGKALVAAYRSAQAREGDTVETKAGSMSDPLFWGLRDAFCLLDVDDLKFEHFALQVRPQVCIDLLRHCTNDATAPDSVFGELRDTPLYVATALAEMMQPVWERGGSHTRDEIEMELATFLELPRPLRSIEGFEKQGFETMLNPAEPSEASAKFYRQLATTWIGYLAIRYMVEAQARGSGVDFSANTCATVVTSFVQTTASTSELLHEKVWRLDEFHEKRYGSWDREEYTPTIT